MVAKKVRKAVIPAAGKGTRFLPATKAVEKEMLPILDAPTIQYIVEEVARSGIETLVLVTGKGKDAIVDHFDYSRELEEELVSSGKTELARRLHEQCDLVNIITVRQPEQKGLGHAIWCAKPAVGDEPFAVLLGDDLVFNCDIPCTKQMIDQYDRYQKSVVALMEVAAEEVSKFGICGGKAISDKVVEVSAMVEKPKLADAPSRDAIVGRYILSAAIFPILDEMVKGGQTGAGGEIQLTDALATLQAIEGVIGYRFDGERFDAGSKDGWLMANIAVAMKRPEIAATLVPFMKSIMNIK